MCLCVCVSLGFVLFCFGTFKTKLHWEEVILLVPYVRIVFGQFQYIDASHEGVCASKPIRSIRMDEVNASFIVCVHRKRNWT